MPNLHSLPFDIYYGISAYLGIDDVVSLASCSRSLRPILNEATLCRLLLEVCLQRNTEHCRPIILTSEQNCAPYSPEATLARERKITYTQALRRLYLRRKALSTGIPVSACTIGYGSDFLYDQGKSCLLRRDDIQVIDIHGSNRSFGISLARILSPLSYQPSARSPITLLSFNDDILTVLYEDQRADKNWLLAIDVISGSPQHVMTPKLLASTSRLFVRHTRNLLYFGTHSATGSHGYREWILQGITFAHSPFRFSPQARMPCAKPQDGEESIKIQLHDFPGTDLGSTIVFKIVDGQHLYALSNCSSFEVVEIDWTSFYHLRRFELFDPPVSDEFMEKAQRIHRRQHWDGPINDSWGDLSLQTDERTNELLIVEARKEWWRGASAQSRAFYVTRISFDDGGQEQTVPEDDLFGPLSTSDSKYAPEPKKLPWQIHSECNHCCYSERHSQPDSLILARTPFRSYNLSTNTFIDIITDPNCCDASSHCVRLRTGSRREGPLTFDCPLSTQNLVKKGKLRPDLPVEPPTWSSTTMDSSSRHEEPKLYRYSPIYLWPAPSHDSERAQRAHSILNMDGSSENTKRKYSGVDIKAVADDRSIVYMIKDSNEDSGVEGKIVCLCFDGEAGICGRNELDANGCKRDDRISVASSNLVDQACSVPQVATPTFGWPRGANSDAAAPLEGGERATAVSASDGRVLDGGLGLPGFGLSLPVAPVAGEAPMFLDVEVQSDVEMAQRYDEQYEDREGEATIDDLCEDWVF